MASKDSNADIAREDTIHEACDGTEDEDSPGTKGGSSQRFGDTADITVRKCLHSMLSSLI